MISEIVIRRIASLIYEPEQRVALLIRYQWLFTEPCPVYFDLIFEIPVSHIWFMGLFKIKINYYNGQMLMIANTCKYISDLINSLRHI